MSQPAQNPPESSALAKVSAAVTEALFLALAFFGGLMVITLLILIGVLPDVKVAPWSGILAGPILMASAAGSYYALERLRAKQGEDHTADPLVPREDRKGGLASALLVPLFVLAALVGSATLGWLQEAIFGAKVAEQEVIVALVERGDVFELAFLASVAVILAPLTEELLFRHMFFRRLRHSAGAQLAWVLPAVAFAVSHWNPIGLAIYTWLGLVFAFAYLYTGRFWVAVAVHAGHNALALAMLVWFPQELASG